MSRYLIWIDLEMTGLDPEKEVILEIATVVTDDRLEPVAEGPNISINCPEEILKTMDEWNRTHHTASGLLERVKTSPYDCRMAEKKTLDLRITGLLEKHYDEINEIRKAAQEKARVEYEKLSELFK